MKVLKKIKKIPISLLFAIIVSITVTVCLAILLLPVGKGSFDSLTAMSQYAQTINEYPSIDNTNWFNPDYTSYYRSQIPSAWDVLRMKFRLKPPRSWSMGLFTQVLEQVTQDRESKHLSGACVQVIEPSEHDRYFLWTDLQGAFHSLVRCLEYLKEQEVITDDLKIKEHCYFIFNGNIFNYGPIILQTFTLVLKLMQVNPEQVFFVRSYHEQPGGWYDTKIAKELHVLNQTKADEVVPNQKQIDSFLQTLPDVVYLVDEKNDQYQAVEVVYTPETENSFSQKCGQAMVLSRDKKSQTIPYETPGLIDNKPINTRVRIMKPEDVKRVTSHPDGLIPVGLQKNIFEWVTFSSPNGRSHQIYQFFFDTILEIDTPGSIDTWTISEYRDDVRDHIGFVFAGTYYLVNGLRPGDQKRIDHLQEQIEQTKKELEEAQRKCAQAEQQH